VSDDATVTITMHGREFVLEEPPVSVVIRILNTLGSVAMRAESAATRSMKNPTSRAALFGLLAVMSEDDLIRLGAAALQFEDDREGRKWLKSHGVKVSPLVKALFANVRLSTDLVEALQGFFEGAESVEAALKPLATLMAETGGEKS